jgi:hypothetical protein
MSRAIGRRDLLWILLGGVFWGSVGAIPMNRLTFVPHPLWHALLFSIVATIVCTLALVRLFRFPVPARLGLSFFYPLLGGLVAIGARWANMCFYSL